jgi:hypothetical protein
MINSNPFKDMPKPLIALSILGLLAPILALFSVMTGKIGNQVITGFRYGAADNLFELLFVLIFVFPISISSVCLLRKYEKSVYFYILGWILVSLSPLCLSSIRKNVESYMIDLSFYILIGVAIAAYLLLSKKVKRYLSG